tara:strand:- start:374 stop:1318 length:945 start_codon:yes stop_codon:yes gene_type:complete
MYKLKIAIIGAGTITLKHLEVLEKIKNISLVGITSRTIAKASKLAKKFNIENTYKNIEDLIAKSKPDALIILVSADQIFKITKKIIIYKIPFFIEKPPGLSPEQTKILANLTTKRNISNMVGYNRRFYSVFHKGLDIIKRHGKLLSISIEGHERFWKIADQLNSNIRSNWIYANSSHTIDLLRFFAGEPKKILSLKKSYVEKKGDQFSSIIEFNSGVLGSYNSFWYSPGGWSVQLFGEGVTVEFKPLESAIWKDIYFKEHKIIPDTHDIIFKPGFYKQMKTFLKMIKTGELDWPGQNLLDSLETMKLSKSISKQ